MLAPPPAGKSALALPELLDATSRFDIVCKRDRRVFTFRSDAPKPFYKRLQNPI